ncbi:MAG: C1 family peptidase [Desulfosarcinaceae bacterium]|jgi:C1A family cysteine protease
MISDTETMGMGWMPDLPDYRDYSPEHKAIKPVVKALGLAKTDGLTLSASVDLRQWCSPVENQGQLGSCTAQAGVGLIEYFEYKAHGRYIDASRLFLYKVTRNLLGWDWDTGAYMRTTMGAMALFGVPPEKYWPYTDRKHPGPSGERTFNDEPPAFLYSFAQNFQALQYFRLDPSGTPTATLLQRIKAYLAAKLPIFFGFTVYASIGQASANGEIPFPCPGEGVRGGHGVMIVGYDDAKTIRNATCGKTTKGAFLMRNSWGAGWGDKGYGWLPYDYVIHGLAKDCWTLYKMEYTDTKQFGI